MRSFLSAKSRSDLSFNARDTLNSNIHYRGITLERTPRFIVIGLGFIGRHTTKEGAVKKEEEDFSKEGGEVSASWGWRKWYCFNLPRGNLVNNRSNYSARWHEDDDDSVKRQAKLFYLCETWKKEKWISNLVEHDDESVIVVQFENDFS